jgi:hypothetical protein
MSPRAESVPSLPWRTMDRLVLGLTLGVGAALILVAWWGASGTPQSSTQTRWLGLGMVGNIVAGAGVTTSLMLGRRSVGMARRRLLSIPVQAVGPPSGVAATTAASDLVAGARMTRYHRAGCPLADGKAVRRASADEHRAAGLVPCGLCRPEDDASGPA